MTRLARTIFLVVSFLGGSLYAQASRTWVSGVGDDANPCSRTAPCKTFAGAISKTATGGEINVLDPGGFGSVTITKAITIDGTGQESSVLASLTLGIVVNAPTTADVILRNLAINGVGTGTQGVRIVAAKSVRMEGVTIFGFRGGTAGSSRGVNIQATNTMDVTMKDCTVRNNTPGFGIEVGSSAAGAVNVTLDNVFSEGNSIGIHVTNGNKATIARSTFTNNSNGIFVDSLNTNVGIYSCVIANNGTGVVSGQAGFTGSIVRLSKNQIHGNLTALANASSTLESHGDNAIAGNNAIGVTPTIIGQQ